MMRGILFYGAMIALLTAFSGCTDDSKGELAISVQLVAAAGVDPYEGVAFMRLSVEVEGETVSGVKQSLFDPSGGSISLDAIPYGVDRQVVIEGWSASQNGALGTLLSRGRSAPVSVDEGDKRVAVKVLMAPVNTFLGITSSLDSTPQSLTHGRVGHTVTKTARGEVVVAGGGIPAAADSFWWDPETPGTIASYHTSVEVLDEVQQHISLHPQGMYFGRIWHSATALPTGQIFLAGGYGNLNGVPQALKRIEVYHPGLSNPIDVIKFDMQVARWGHTATLVDAESFTVLFVGGDPGGSTHGTYELWNPYVGTIDSGALPDSTWRRHHQATAFEVPGRGPAVLISGGQSGSTVLDSMLIYDVLTNTMLVHPEKMSTARTEHAAVWVPGRNFIYLTGGFTNGTRSATSTAIDVYDTANDHIQIMGGFSLKTARAGHSVAKAYGNSAVFMGGTGPGGAALDSIEIIYEYLDAATGSYRIEVTQSKTGGAGSVPFMASPRTGARSVVTDGGMVLTVGGMGATNNLPAELLLYNPF